MRQLIIGGYNDALSKTGTEYNALSGGQIWSTGTTINKQAVSTPGILSSLAVELSAAPGGSGSYTLTLQNVTQSTSLAVTITDPATTNINTGTLSVAAGDVIQLQSTYSAPSATPSARWSVIFEGTNAKESLILGEVFAWKSATGYSPIAQGSNDFGTETQSYQVIPTSGTIKNLFVALSADPGTNPDAYRFTLIKYTAGVGGATSLTVTITADNTTGNDTANKVAVAAGDYVCMMIEPLNTPSVTSNCLVWVLPLLLIPMGSL